MPILAAGSSTPGPQRLRARGFTLIELLVVVSIIAIASAGVAFALRDSADTALQREAQRLAALLESARAQSRTLGVAVVWRSSGPGFAFDGLPAGSLPGNWLGPDTRTADNTRLELGPDPIIAAQSVTLLSLRQGAAAWRVASDGLRPFTVQLAEPAAAGAGVQP